MPGSLAGLSMLPRCRATGGVPMGTMTGVERPTTVVRLDAGPVEYRLERRGDATVVVFHGGQHRAGLALGEEVFADAGYSVLVPSRPGYGRTPVSTGTSVTGFADVTRALCAHLGITRVAAVVGTSGGGPTAVTTAARHPDLVQRLILQCAVGPLPYPDRRTRLGAHVMFAGATEGATWRAGHLDRAVEEEEDTGHREQPEQPRLAQNDAPAPGRRRRHGANGGGPPRRGRRSSPHRRRSPSRDRPARSARRLAPGPPRTPPA